MNREFFARCSWLCPLACALLAVAVLVYFGVSLWSALLAALLLLCPVVVAWGAWRAWREGERTREWHHRRNP
jgi:hypothetical protein